MSTQVRTDRVRLKIERAKEHIRDLEAAIQAFVGEKPYTLAARSHPVVAIQHTTLYIAEVKPIPDRFSLLIGDAVHNLRSTLDHLLWQLVEASGGTPGPSIQFPVCQGPKGPHQYVSAMGNSEIQKIPQDARDIIQSVQPYITVGQNLWLLHHLDIVDKHRLLLTVAQAMDKWGVDVASGLQIRFDEYRFVPLVVGNEVVNIPTSTYERQAHQDFQLGLEITFGETEVPEGEPVVYTLNKLADFVDELVEKFDTFLK